MSPGKIALALVLSVLSGCDDAATTDADPDGVIDGDIVDGGDAGDEGDAADDEDAATVSICGNGLVEEGEYCDGDELGDELECASDCTPTAPFLEYDAVIREFMERWGIPGGAVALTADERLVLVRAYGLADVAADEPVARDSLFRIASVSKPVTAVAVMQLAEDGLIDLDEGAFSYLEHLPVIEGGTEDPRLADITVTQLLTHSGGWNASASFDPMFRNIEVAEAFGIPGPAEVEQIIRWTRGLPLDFDPGTAYAYSNFGYAVLGRIIEAVTGEDYEAWVKEHVLAPMGIGRMRIGGSRLEDRVEGEVRYYSPEGAASVFPDEVTASWAYGGFYLESLDSHGGWIASTIDLTRLLLSTDGRDGVPDVLQPETLDQMLAHPGAPLWPDGDVWYAQGWLVRPAGSGYRVWHDGSLPGTTSAIVRTEDGITWVALFNRRSDLQLDEFSTDFQESLWEAFLTVDEWPDYDLMPRYAAN